MIHDFKKNFCYRVDELYNFLHIWVPHLYGDLDEMDPKARGYELVESDTEIWDEEEVPQGDGTGDLGENDDLADLTRESWEVSIHRGGPKSQVLPVDNS